MKHKDDCLGLVAERKYGVVPGEIFVLLCNCEPLPPTKWFNLWNLFRYKYKVPADVEREIRS
jgi:hypothetical protein